MNRVIKFRAFNDLHGMSRPFYLSDATVEWRNASGDLFASNGLDTLGALDSILMQYTGLKDKNGADVYEGDVARYKSYRPVASMPWIGEVMWQEFRGCWSIGKRGAYNNDLFQYIQNGGQCEVIGNVFMNPELLGLSTTSSETTEERKATHRTT